jgi:hypothetical protein
MTDAQFGNLTGAPAYGIRMASHTGGGVEHRSHPVARVLLFLEERLIVRKGVSSRLGNTIAYAVGAGIRSYGRRVKARRCFRGGVLCDENNRPRDNTKAVNRFL